MVGSFFFLKYIDKRLVKVLKPYINVEVERITNNIVTRTITNMDLSSDMDKYIDIKRNEGKIDNISYHTSYINKISNDVTKNVLDTLKNIDNGVLDDYFISDRVKTGKFNKVKGGIFCEVSLGSIRNSIILSNISPSIPIRLYFLGQVNSEIKVKSTSYGVNNIMIEVFLIVTVKEIVSMPVSSLRKNIIIKEPLSIEIIPGEVPHYIGVR